MHKAKLLTSLFFLIIGFWPIVSCAQDSEQYQEVLGWDLADTSGCEQLHNCYGRGQCKEGACVCQASFFDSDCSLEYVLWQENPNYPNCYNVGDVTKGESKQCVKIVNSEDTPSQEQTRASLIDMRRWCAMCLEVESCPLIDWRDNYWVDDNQLTNVYINIDSCQISVGLGYDNAGSKSLIVYPVK